LPLFQKVNENIDMKKFLFLSVFFTFSSPLLGQPIKVEQRELEMEVHILGLVDRPGLYKFPLITRANEAIRKANDVEKEVEEFVLVREEGEEITRKKFNLINYRRKGEIEHNPFVSNFDMLLITKLAPGSGNVNYLECLRLIFEGKNIEKKP